MMFPNIDRITRYLVLLLLLSGLLQLSAQQNGAVDKNNLEQYEYNDTNRPRSSRGDYGRFRSLNKTSQIPGFAKYYRPVVLDGNLVTGGITNTGMISHANTSVARTSWPKGPFQVDYIFGAFFYVAAEVVDANGDTIPIVSDYYRFGETAPDGSHRYLFTALPRYYNLDEPNALETPLVFGISEDVGLDGEPGTNDEGENDGILQPIEDFNGNGVLDLSMKNNVGWFATTARRETWPEFWPPQSYPGDNRQENEYVPGVRAGRWNGEFGAKLRADQETYFVMDDRENDEFQYYPFDDPRPWPEGRRGLGVKIESRTYQWNARLAEDIVIHIYDITNLGKDLDKSVVGMLVDPDMGGQFNNDDADAEVIDDITYTWNRGGRDLDTGLPTGYFGFAFLESPGLSFDGIDNDLDGQIDESQNDGIDNDGDWRTWVDLDGDGVFTNEDTNYNRELDEGEDVNGNGKLDIDQINDDTGSDGIGPEEAGYPGPDPDGTEANGIPDLGEPNFETTDNDESDQVGLTSVYFRPGTGYMGNDRNFWEQHLQPRPDSLIGRTSDWRSDVAFTYGSGFVEFKERVVNGQAFKETHRYAISLVFGNDFNDIFRNKRTMQIIYDNDYNFSKPPDTPTLTLTAGDGKVYLQWDEIAEKSFDPIYKKDFEAYYIYKSSQPTFDDIKTITDAFGNPLLFKPMEIFDLVDGLRGIHPVRIGSELGSVSDLGVSYNLGNDSGLRHFYIDSVDVTNGRTYYYAISAIDMGWDPSFFAITNDSSKMSLAPISPTETPVNIQVDLLGRPISYGRNTARAIPTEMVAGWVPPSVSDEGFQHVSGNGTGKVNIEVYNPLMMKEGYRYRIEFDDDGSFEALDSSYTGVMNKVTIISETENRTLKVFERPKNNDRSEATIVDGFQFLLFNDSTYIDTAQTKWISGNSNLGYQDLTEASFNRVPRDFEIRVLGENADSTITRRPVNYQIWDVTDPDNPIKMDFFTFDRNNIGILDHEDDITIVKLVGGRKNLYRLKFSFPANITPDEYRIPQNGDVFKIVTHKSFDRNDVITFQLKGNSVSTTKAKSDLDDIYVVPDPYIAVSSVERLVINQDEGRGSRNIDFVNLPAKCTVKIFTAAGKHVQTLEHNATADKRRLSWDLRTKDGLEVAFGVYFYVVEAEGIGIKTGKFAIIK